ncbi:hypothetical protein [Mechercharimyces sp. CAU 1602]|uniref:hypothetical protein n=1 Tax=Mechercharimyces sp. CAU 1602 TaxID=2973933 RepID=UPI002161BFE4|nr:hypothetical protein [Mechercharimyces sp. CAU 1602]MCS1350323.1 hypothetical protein [Mechercharimyces sp. CAU 1602]
MFEMFKAVKERQIDKAKSAMTPSDICTIGEKEVRVTKVTAKKFKEIIRVVERLPGLLLQVIRAPEHEVHAHLVAALELALDEVIAVTSILSGIEEEYLSENAGLDELVAYFIAMERHNNLSRTVKNVMSLLPKVQMEKSEQ